MVSRRRRWWVWPVGALGAPVGVVGVWLLVAAVVYSPEYVRRVVVWQESDVGDYLHHFPRRALTASPDPAPFARTPDEERVRAAFERALAVSDLEDFLRESGTQALLVIKDDALLYERYVNGTRRDSVLTSFSVAKSVTSALIGIAIDEGLIGSVNDPITGYLPELADQDERLTEVTIRHLLLMSSGLEYQETRWAVFNGDDALTTYYPDQRALALEHARVAGPPGEVFDYNKYHPQLLGMILERTTGMSVTEYLQTRLWDPAGMEYDGAWALDSEASGFEKMEAGLNARAVDFAKLGRLFLADGARDGVPLVSAAWVRESTEPSEAMLNPDRYRDAFGRSVYGGGTGYYALMWYGLLRAGSDPDFAAEGDHGQFIYVSPAHHMVIVRNGVEYGISSHEWMDAFRRFAERF